MGAMSGPRRIWFYRPSWFWFGWATLLPIYRGHDEWARWTLVLGWTITGRVVIALNRCGHAECEYDRYMRLRADSVTELADVMAEFGITEADLDD